jgi:TonB-dependent SusC/RagA subfamily outer membrane receptor
LEGRVAGVQVFQKANPGADPAIVIRGTRTINGESRPLFVVNGIPVQELDLNTLNPYDISNVTVLKDAEAVALYGSQASFGVIIIELKNYRNARWRRDFNTGYNYMSRLITATGTPFAVPKRFYVPKYASVVTEERTDFRETIYWNPVVQTDKNGRAEVEYYNSDAATTFRAIAEGIAWNGKLGRAEVTYASQPAMRVDAKIPPYLTVGDKARIPLFIKNNTTEELKVSITVAVPAGFTTTDTLRRLQLAPDSSCQLQIPVEAGSRSEGTIRFIVINQFGKEIISLPISAADKGFPVYETCSGDRDKQYEFNVRDLVPGTLRARLQVFKNLEGQLLNGIESMIREPYGCFEQTSSSTYPNIFVLRYLKESGRSNPEIEQKALGYIKQGYKRLIGFETSQNGFEWFGHAPAHEALTAYGLLEFTDMKEFVEVDERMLARTRDFLLKRRDGNGSFKIASGGYDRFASVPDRIAHIYIVYAMTRAGFGSDIRPEYDAAVKKAIQSNDGYMMAMMALSASYMKNEDDFRTLMKALRKLFQGGELQSETSVVNSHDASLRVEAFSLFAQALMREDSPDLGLIGKLLTRVLAEKSYYGYGSTQATVLALQTIVEYYRLVGRLSGDSPVAFAMNDKPVAPDSDVKNFLQPGNNRFTVAYPEPGKNYPYELEISYNTYLPRSSEKAALSLKTILQRDHARVGETVRMDIAVTNTRDMLQPMAIAKVGIPAGLSVQPWQLKELMEKNEFSYYEIFDNYLVFYWMGFAVGETKTIHLDLKADVPGVYKAKASSVYLYYTPEQKCWAEGTWVELE